MHRKTTMFHSALMLTSVNLLLRFLGTGFQVYLSGRIGAEGIGLLQLTMSVGSLAMVAGMAGIRTTAMYLTAEELGKKQPGGVCWVLSGCVRYSLICSGCIALILGIGAPYVAENWIRQAAVIPSLRLFAGFLPVSCLCGVMTGYFTAAGRIPVLAAAEVAEQLFSMAVTVACLGLWGGSGPESACECVILGSGMGACLTLGCLTVLRLRESAAPGPRLPMARRLARQAIPLALADILRSGISTLENLLVPRRLAMYPGIRQPLAAFGLLSGMVFPVLMFPACLLFGVAELLIPELARCHAVGQTQRIRYLVGRGLRVALVYGLLFGGGMYLAAPALCQSLYDNAEAGQWLRRYALLIPMLYCDALTDAMTKGLGQQKICVRYNILTSAMDVGMLYVLLPAYGMEGYYFSFLISHACNFLLSLRLLLRLTRVQVPPHLPPACILGALGALWGASTLGSTPVRLAAFAALLVSLLTLGGVIRKEDLRWVKSMVTG